MREKYITMARMINKPILPISSAKSSSCTNTKMKLYNKVSVPNMKLANLFSFKTPNKYSEISIVVINAAIK